MIKQPTSWGRWYSLNLTEVLQLNSVCMSKKKWKVHFSDLNQHSVTERLSCFFNTQKTFTFTLTASSRGPTAFYWECLNLFWEKWPFHSADLCKHPEAVTCWQLTSVLILKFDSNALDNRLNLLWWGIISFHYLYSRRCRREECKVCHSKDRWQWETMLCKSNTVKYKGNTRKKTFILHIQQLKAPWSRV